MKHFLSVILLLFLFGCISSDPAQNLINQQKLIGVWELNEVMINGRPIKYRDDIKEGEYLHVDLQKNSDLVLSSHDQELNSDMNDSEFKYIVDGGKLRILVFNKNDSGEFSFNFKINSDILTLSNMRMKSNSIGRINFKAMFPDVKSMSLVLKRF